MTVEDIDTIVVVMLENRSFDHMLGYLSLDETPNKLAVDGLRSDPQWQASYANRAGGESHPLKKFNTSQRIDQDPPHDNARIADQINTAPVGPSPQEMGIPIDLRRRARGRGRRSRRGDGLLRRQGRAGLRLPRAQFLRVQQVVYALAEGHKIIG